MEVATNSIHENNFANTNDPVQQQVQDTINKATQALYNTVIQWLHDHPQGSNQDLQSIFDAARTAANTQLGIDIQAIGTEDYHNWDIINSINPWNVFNSQYADVAQSWIWGDHAQPFPAPSGGSSIHDQIQNDYTTAKGLVDALNALIEKNQTHANDIQTQIDNLNAEIADLEAKAAGVPAGSQTALDLASLKTAVAILMSDLTATNGTLVTLAGELTALTAQLDPLEKLTEIAIPSDTDLANANADLAAIQKTNAAMNGAISSLPNLDSDLAALTAAIDALHKDMPSTHDAIQKDLDAATQAYDAITAQAAADQKAIDAAIALKSQIDALAATVAALPEGSQKQDAMVALQKLQADYKTLSDAATAAQADLDGLNISSLSDVISALQTLAGKTDPTQDDLTTADSDQAKVLAVQAAQKSFDTTDMPAVTTSAVNTDIGALNAILNPTTQNPDYPYLTLNGITYQIINGLYIPYGGMRDGYSASEAWGYSIRNAVNNGDIQFAQNLLNSFYHFSKASVQWIKDHKDMDDPNRWGDISPYLLGLMGWHINAATGGYSNEGDESSATDADIDILNALIDLAQKDPNLVISDPTDPTDTLTAHDLAKQAVSAFAHCDCYLKGGAIGFTYDCWGDISIHPDYYDPAAMAKISQFAKDNDMQMVDPSGKAISVGEVIDTASRLEMGRITAEIQNQGMIGDNYGSTSWGSSEALRFLLRFGQFISMPNVDKTSQMYKDAVNALQATIEQLFAKNMVNLNHNFGQGDTSADISGLARGQSTGPLLLAIMALQNANALPANVTGAMVDQLKSDFMDDLTKQFQGIEQWTPEQYQENGNYFGLELINLAQSIMQQNGIYPFAPPAPPSIHDQIQKDLTDGTAVYNTITTQAAADQKTIDRANGLKAQIDALAATVAALPEGSQKQAATLALQTLQADYKTLSAAAAAAQTQLSALNQQITALSSTIADLQTLAGITDSKPEDLTKADADKTAISTVQSQQAAFDKTYMPSVDATKVDADIAALNQILNPTPTPTPGGEDTLTVDGVSVLKKTVNGVTMYFPISRGTQGGGSYAPNESFGYYLRAYVAAGDKESYQCMLNGLYYLMNQTNMVRVQNGGGSQPMGDSWNEIGLTGWNYNLASIFNGKNPYMDSATDNTSYLNTASDADEDIIRAMIEGYNAWGEMSATDPLSSGTGVISSSTNADHLSTMNLSDMIKVSGFSFLRADKNPDGSLSLGDFQSSSSQHNPYLDYFDPVMYAELSAFLTKNQTPPANVNWIKAPWGPSPVYDDQTAAQEIALLKAGAEASWNFISSQAKANGGWITDSFDPNAGGSNDPKKFDGESTRSLMRLGEYILFCKKNGDPFGILADVKQTLSTLVSNLFAQGGFQPSCDVPGYSGSIQFKNLNQMWSQTPGFYGGMISGPLSVALAALGDDLPPGVTAEEVAAVKNALKFDLGNSLGGTYDPKLPVDGQWGSDWQEGGKDGMRGYFATCLAIMSQQILNSYSASAIQPAERSRSDDFSEMRA